MKHDEATLWFQIDHKVRYQRAGKKQQHLVTYKFSRADSQISMVFKLVWLYSQYLPISFSSRVNFFHRVVWNQRVIFL